jgi:Putative zinc-finger
MEWQCALLQRWLPEYPDGDLPAWRKRWLTSHLAGCSACREQLAEIREALAALEAAPVTDPGPDFWREFSRDLHLKLVQASQDGQTAPAPASPRQFRLPYLLGAPALALLLLYVAVHLTGTGVPVQKYAMVKRPPAAQKEAVVQPAPAPPAAAKMAAVPKPAPESPAMVAPAPALPTEPEQFVTVGLEEGAPLPDEDIDLSGFDLDSELAGMTEQEKNAFLNNLHQRKKDGSCIDGLLSCSWG